MYTNDIESDMQIFTDMRPSLSFLGEFHQRGPARQYLIYCVSDTPQAPAATMRPTQVIRQAYYLSEINYARLFLAYLLGLFALFTRIQTGGRGANFALHRYPCDPQEDGGNTCVMRRADTSQNESIVILDCWISTGRFSRLRAPRLRASLEFNPPEAPRMA